MFLIKTDTQKQKGELKF